MTEPVVLRCTRGPRCHASERVGDTLIGAPTARPLCDVCENSARRVLDHAPELYVRLRLKLRDTDVTARGPQVTISKSRPLPLNARALDLAEQLHILLTRWEDEVRLIAGLTDAHRARLPEGRQVQAAARLLGQYLPAWINAPTTAFAVSMTEPEIDQSGADAVGALIDWRAQVRAVPGLDPSGPRATRRYPHPCTECGVAAVTHAAGDDLTECRSCGATSPYTDLEETAA